MPLLWVDRLVMVQMCLTKIQFSNVSDADKRQISSKGASMLMGAASQTDERIK